MKQKIAIALATSLLIGTTVSHSAPLQSPPLVTLPQATFRGSDNGEVASFLGMPYAAAPEGHRRWMPPAAVRSRDGVQDATQFSASCPQQLSNTPVSFWTMEYLPPPALGTSEDCLTLNVWTPARWPDARARRDLPVLFFIHGGGFTSGSSSVPIYDGAKLAARGMIVVTVNYRVGPAGFLAHPELSAEQQGRSGNYAIQDQIAALRWVRDHVGAFGGDPAKVTIAGQSAGAWSVMALLHSPQAKGLFRAAIAMSTPDLGAYRSLEQGEQRGVDLFSRWNVKSLAEARALPPEKLTGAVAFGNIVQDGHVIPAGTTARDMASDVPMMLGYTFNDLFIPRLKFDAAGWAADVRRRYGRDAEAFLKLYPGRTAEEATHSATREAGERLEFGQILSWLTERTARSPVYVYRFSHVEPGPDSATYGAFHTSDVPYMFDTLDRSPERPFTSTDRAVVRQFSGAIENFIKNADPNGAAIPKWSPVTVRGKEMLEFGDKAVASRIHSRGADELIARGKAPERPKFPGQ